MRKAGTEIKGITYRYEEEDEVIKRYRVDGETICSACIEEELEEITNGDVLTEMIWRKNVFGNEGT